MYTICTQIFFKNPALDSKVQYRPSKGTSLSKVKEQLQLRSGEKSMSLFRFVQISLARVSALYRTSSSCVVLSLCNLPPLKLYFWWAAIYVARFLLAVYVSSSDSAIVMPDNLPHSFKLFYTSQRFFFPFEILRLLHERTSRHIKQKRSTQGSFVLIRLC